MCLEHTIMDTTTYVTRCIYTYIYGKIIQSSLPIHLWAASELQESCIQNRYIQRSFLPCHSYTFTKDYKHVLIKNTKHKYTVQNDDYAYYVRFTFSYCIYTCMYLSIYKYGTHIQHRSLQS